MVLGRTGDGWTAAQLVQAGSVFAHCRIAAAQPAGFEPAANIGPNDVADDRGRFEQHGWRITAPCAVAGTPEQYHAYLRDSRAEILCCKPIFKELKTGWISDRSAGYLASGRPVLMEDCGTSEHLPWGHGILSVASLEEAAAQVAEIDENYLIHARAARGLAEHYFGRAAVSN